MKKKFFLILLLIFISIKSFSQLATREEWLLFMDKVARPVIENLSKDKLKANMIVELSPSIDNPEGRKQAAYLEAFARTLSGISPWINLEGGSKEEVKLRTKYREWTLKAIDHATNPKSEDYLLWKGGQPLVDASFFALALVRCPWIWANLDERVKQQVQEALLQSRPVIPVYSNWILFSSMIEAFFCQQGLPYDKLRIEFGVREFSQHWYLGDGVFSDGNHFAMDYYNSYVIHPYLTDIYVALKGKDKSFDWFKEDLKKYNLRYAEIQERMINTDGSFPALGRSIVYRSGAFHHLANMALKKKLPPSLSPAQVRGGLTAVIKKTLGAPNTFNKTGWLNIGLAGHQPEQADFYINTGSLYLCSEIFLPLGLSEDEPFWSDQDQPWSAVKIWRGENVKADHKIRD